MKTLLLMAALSLASRTAVASVKFEIVVPTQEEVVRHAVPVKFNVVQTSDGNIVLNLELKDAPRMVQTFIAYELRVIKEPVTVTGLNREFHNLDRISRRESRKEKNSEFVLQQREVPNAYLIVSFSILDGDGVETPNIRVFCLTIAALSDRIKNTPNKAPEPTTTSVTPRAS